MIKQGYYNDKLAELKQVSSELNAMIEEGSFYRLPFYSRYSYIRKVKRLYNELLGPVSPIKLRHILAAAAFVVVGVGCAGPGGGSSGVITPSFTASGSNPFGLADVGTYASPCFVDIDNDGDLDAFVGNFDGNMIYFQNTGTAAAPAFAASSANPFGLVDVGGYTSPCFVDIDNDGDLDAFVGNFDGSMIYFQNTGTAAAPAFAASSANPFGLDNVGYFASPCFVDIDNDGDLDAFVGNSNGNMIYFQNTGTAAAPAFAASSANPFGLAYVGDYISPRFKDIDNDGDLDAFVGNFDGSMIYFQNTGTASAPAFAASSSNPFGLANVGYFASPCFVDIDNDGDLDAFVGAVDGNTYYFVDTAK